MLVVDDKEGFREQLRHIFTYEGYEVAAAGSGKEAIEALDRFAPDIVMTDIVMPHGDGFFVLEQVQQRGLQCPVVVITAYGSQESAVRALRLGAYDYITKPFDLDVILAVVQRAAEYRRLQLSVVQGQKDLATRVSQMQALYETSLDLVSHLSLPEVLQSIMKRTVELLHVKGGNICLYDETTNRISVEVGRGPWKDMAGAQLALGEGLSGRVAQSGQPLRVQNYADWEGRLTRFSVLDFASAVGVPLMVQDRVVGVLTVVDDAPRGGFSEDDEALLMKLAPLAALAIERARLHSQTRHQLVEMERSHQEIHALQELTAAIQSSLSLPDVLHRIAQGVVTGLGYRAAMVAVYDARKDALIVQSAVIDRTLWAEGERLAGMGLIGGYLTMDREENLAIRSAKQGEVATTHTLHDLFRPAVDPETAQVLQQMAGVRVLATVPLMTQGKLVGNFFAGSHRESLSQSDIASLRAFGRQAALAIEHARLYSIETQRFRLADMIRGTSAIINSTLNWDELLALILEQLAWVFPYDSCGLFLLQGGELELAAGRVFENPGHLPEEELRGTPRDLMDTLLRGRHALVLPDVPEGMRWPAGQPTPVRSWIGVPLIARDQVLGVLTINNHTADAYAAEDEQHASAFAQQVAVAMVNARLYAEAGRNLREQRYLHEIGHVFNSTLDLEQLLTSVMAKTNELLGVEAGSVALLTEDGQEVVFHASVGGGSEVVKGLRIPADKGIVGWVVQRAESLLVPDVTQEPRHYAQVDLESGFKTRSILCVPLISKGKVIGAIEVLNKIAGQFSPDDQRMTEALALSAATAIENAQLYRQVTQTLEQLQQTQDELVRAQRLAVLGQIGVTVRHEVNNPLTAVLGNADWLLQVLGDLEDEPQRALEAIRVNALRIRDIVNKLEDIRSDRVTEYVPGIEMIDLYHQDEPTAPGGVEGETV
ncbi:MAG: GAF domain-containing protein [Chloroflexota bacterium]